MIQRKPTRRFPRLLLARCCAEEDRSVRPDPGSELGWLVSSGDRLDNLRGQERQPQQSSDVAGADALALSNLRH